MNKEVSGKTQITTNAYVPIGGSTLDTIDTSSGVVAYLVRAQGSAPNNNSITVKVEGSYDGSTWVDVTAQDPTTGAARGSAEVPVANAANAEMIVTGGYLAGVKAGYRYFRLSVKATAGGSQGTAIVSGHAK